MKECKKDELAWFLTYAFVIPLACVWLMNTVSSYDANGILSLILYGIEAATPSLAVIIVIIQKYGTCELKEFLKNKYVDCLNIKFCIIGFCVPVLLLTIGKLLTYLTPYNNQFLTNISANKLLIIMWALIAEELGWRGYLQDKIEKRFGMIVTPLIIGIIWATWHYHFFISGSMEVPVILFTYGCITESCGYFVITKLAKGNIMPASLWHFSGNLFFNIYKLNPNWNNGSIIPYFIVSAVYTVYLILFIWYIFREKRTLARFEG